MENKLDKAVDIIVKSLTFGGKILTFGVGGNATTSMHFAGELAGKFEQFENTLPCICLSENPGVLTAITNDFGWDQVFKRQLSALGSDGDVVVIFSISTSGVYLLPAIKEAAISGCSIILICGKDTHNVGNALVDLTWELGSLDTPLIQEEQLRIVHLLCGNVKSRLVNKEESHVSSR